MAGRFGGVGGDDPVDVFDVFDDVEGLLEEVGVVCEPCGVESIGGAIEAACEEESVEVAGPEFELAGEGVFGVVGFRRDVRKGEFGV